MKHIAMIVLLAVVFVGLLVVSGTFYIVTETEQVVITRFGKPIGDPITEPGLKIKTPFIQKANYFPKRFLEWDGDPNQLPTRDKRFIHVDTYARWRITDPLQFFRRLRDERGAQSRLDDILDGETRNTVAKHDLIEVVRSTDRQFAVTSELGDDGEPAAQAPIEYGRALLEAEVLRSAGARASDLGIEILDFRFKRINYVEAVRKEVYSRMISERKRIAEQFRSEGAGEAARINGEKERELQVIGSAAYREAQGIKGRADAEATEIYARAHNLDPDFYRFTKSMDVFGKTLDKTTTLVLGTDGEFLRYLERSK